MEKIIKDLKEMILLTQGVYAPDKAIINITTEEARQIVEALEGREEQKRYRVKFKHHAHAGEGRYRDDVFRKDFDDLRNAHAYLLYARNIDYDSVRQHDSELAEAYGSGHFTDDGKIVVVYLEKEIPLTTPPQTQEGEG